MMRISFRKYIVFIFIPIIAIAALLYYVASNNVEQFFEHETELAVTSINSADALIQQYLIGLRRNVGHFASNYQDDLQQLVDKPDDSKLHQKIRESVDMYFPGAATFTIADSQGKVLLDDVDTLIGKGCRENIRLFSISSQQSDAQLRIHSDRLNYHFDIMHEMRTTDGRVMVFFVSFEPLDIANYISNLQLPGHQLLIIKKNADSLMKVTEQGARVKLEREKNLIPTELERALAKKDVTNTLWQLIDIIDENRISQAKSIVFRDFGIIFGSFVLGTLLAFITIMKHERLRFYAESRLDKTA